VLGVLPVATSVSALADFIERQEIAMAVIARKSFLVDCIFEEKSF
jgi:hypothetical protein